MSKRKKPGGNLYFGTSVKSVYPLTGDTRALLDLLIAFGIGIMMLILNLMINFSSTICTVFDESNNIFFSRVIINILFFWLAVLMILAFLRWRSSSKKALELESIVSSICPDTLMVVDISRKILLCTASVEGMFGYDVEEVLGSETTLIYSDRRQNKEDPREIYDAINKQGFHIGTAEGYHKDGSKFPLEIISADLSGRQGAVLLLRDISERVKAEKHRLEIEKKLQQRHKLESLGVLAGGIAHDFNNFLMVIQGNLDLLKFSLADNSELSENLSDMSNACDNASDLCKQMMIYAGRGKSVKKSTDISELVTATIKLLKSSALKDIKLQLDIHDGLPEILIDESQIRQIILNLLTNAADAITKDGEISITISKRELSDIIIEDFYFGNAPDCESFIMVEVKDSGVGMSEDTIENIFEPFFTTKPTGRGLGLASVHGIMRGHNGGLKVWSKPGEGSVFTLLFPITDT